MFKTCNTQETSNTRCNPLVYKIDVLRYSSKTQAIEWISFAFLVEEGGDHHWIYSKELEGRNPRVSGVHSGSLNHMLQSGERLYQGPENSHCSIPSDVFVLREA